MPLDNLRRKKKATNSSDDAERENFDQTVTNIVERQNKDHAIKGYFCFIYGFQFSESNFFLLNIFFI